jgi:hypothetical protein
VLVLSKQKKRNKAVNLHSSAKKPATQTKWKQTIHVCNRFHGGECWVQTKTNGKQQRQANKAFNRQTKHLTEPSTSHRNNVLYSIAEINKLMVQERAKGQTNKLNRLSQTINEERTDQMLIFFTRSIKVS